MCIKENINMFDNWEKTTGKRHLGGNYFGILTRGIKPFLKVFQCQIHCIKKNVFGLFALC